MARVLYISYDGMTEPLGQSQVVAYLEKLATDNEIHVLSFEKPSDLDSPQKIASARARLQAARIGWTPMRYHKHPSALATLYDIARGQLAALRIARSMRAEIIHVRSYVPGLIALPVKQLTGAKLLFDIRGFWADERVDGGIWRPKGSIYVTVKRLERRLFRAADHVVTLTEASVPEITRFGYWDGPSAPITVIPTCADLDRFTPPPTPAPPDPFTFGYVGSFGTWYLMDETLALFGAILKRRPNARMLIVNRHEHNSLRAAAARMGLPTDRIEIGGTPHAEVANRIQKMHAASALIRPCFSKLSSAPTKLAEYLGCGVPCIGNTGVGDMEAILEGEGTGVALRSFETAALVQAAERILEMSNSPIVRARCRDTALSRFSLTGGVAAYSAIYKRLTVQT
jgi:glycosyltransferase involved in cell wall biosynthesis